MCADAGSGVASCSGTTANGTAIDTATAGAKSFAVTATDAVGNVANSIVSYSVAANTISVSNLPEEGTVGASFVATVHLWRQRRNVGHIEYSVAVRSVGHDGDVYKAGQVHDRCARIGDRIVRRGHRQSAVIPHR